MYTCLHAFLYKDNNLNFEQLIGLGDLFIIGIAQVIKRIEKVQEYPLNQTN